MENKHVQQNLIIEKNLEENENITKTNKINKYPTSVFFIFGNEFCER